MANLAIKGHATRGKEVIEILEMLGGNNLHNHIADCEGLYFYIDKETKIIYYDWNNYPENSDVYLLSLEQFLEKFPYKVGDKVRVYEFESEVRINDMKWDGSEVQYEVFTDETEGYSAEELNECNQPLHRTKEESTEEPKELLIGFTKDDNGDWVLNTHKDYEIKEFGGKFKLVKKQPQYPKTYEECCNVLKIPNDGRYIDIDVPLDYNKLLSAFTKLFICRDAYWKIAGDWKPDWCDENKLKYSIECSFGTINRRAMTCNKNHFLAFPTEEIRNAFYENFKKLIEECKELL